MKDIIMCEYASLKCVDMFGIGDGIKFAKYSDGTYSITVTTDSTSAYITLSDVEVKDITIALIRMTKSIKE